MTKYKYSDQLNSESISEERILLPTDAIGNPDWAYMDTFMSKMLDDAEVSLENLMQVLSTPFPSTRA
ncbi:hypothetical protein PL948_02820 [Bifidobacterium adolescentis]|nr:hypothetical protein [Bifidobacterium adolescentis]